MFRPVSSTEYVLLDPNAQAIIVACPMRTKLPALLETWSKRAVGIVGDSEQYLPGLVRDILANPQIRVVCFVERACGREAYDAFWSGTGDPGWGIDLEHLNLVRQFVDLRDDDFTMKLAHQPFWPTRLIYKEKTP